MSVIRHKAKQVGGRRSRKLLSALLDGTFLDEPRISERMIRVPPLAAWTPAAVREFLGHLWTHAAMMELAESQPDPRKVRLLLGRAVDHLFVEEQALSLERVLETLLDHAHDNFHGETARPKIAKALVLLAAGVEAAEENFAPIWPRRAKMCVRARAPR